MTRDLGRKVGRIQAAKDIKDIKLRSVNIHP